MFENIIYFISALILSVLYTDSGADSFSFKFSAAFLILSFIFIYLLSDTLFKKAARNNKTDLFRPYLKKLSVSAIIIFAVNIYIFEIPQIISGRINFFKNETLGPLAMISVFTGFMLVIWERFYSYSPEYKTSEISKKEYIFTQLGFSLPSLFPWFVISSAFDILELLPFKNKMLFTDSFTGQIIYGLLLILLISVFIPVILKKFWKCRKLEDVETRKILDDLSEKTGVKYKQALIWPIFQGKMITAGVIGLFKNFRYILVTKAFCDYLEPEEKKAVIAHELGHIKKNHMILYLLIFAGFIICSYSLLEPAALLLLIFNPQPFERFIPSQNFISLITALIFMASFIVYFRYVFGFFMRNFERQADGYSFKITGASFPLVSTFKKISMLSPGSEDEPNWHHYSIRQRIEFLLKCQLDKDLVKKHDKKVNLILFIYFLVVSIIFLAGAKTEVYKSGFIKKNAERIILSELEKNPENFELYHYLGNLMTGQNNEEKAVEAYEKALSINKNLPETLNNLAWIYITSENDKIQNTEKGIKLAEKAADLTDLQKSYLLDTLAEGYFRNRNFEKACIYAKKAYENAEENKKYYQDQLAKICKQR
jgi:Zn-dependent protease with chaperone function